MNILFKLFVYNLGLQEQEHLCSHSNAPPQHRSGFLEPRFGAGCFDNRYDEFFYNGQGSSVS